MRVDTHVSRPPASSMPKQTSHMPRAVGAAATGVTAATAAAAATWVGGAGREVHQLAPRQLVCRRTTAYPLRSGQQAKRAAAGASGGASRDVTGQGSTSVAATSSAVRVTSEWGEDRGSETRCMQDGRESLRSRTISGGAPCRWTAGVAAPSTELVRAHKRVSAHHAALWVMPTNERDGKQVSTFGRRRDTVRHVRREPSVAGEAVGTVQTHVLVAGMNPLTCQCACKPTDSTTDIGEESHSCTNRNVDAVGDNSASTSALTDEAARFNFVFGRAAGGVVEGVRRSASMCGVQNKGWQEVLRAKQAAPGTEMLTGSCACWKAPSSACLKNWKDSARCTSHTTHTRPAPAAMYNTRGSGMA
mmetsp:Transcript_1336/g.3182  ORF Transcript_1336/g.3182 Transcript_1336/m.3182 type:complete len:360 (-) Transcript_1336:197-1276(-)